MSLSVSERLKALSEGKKIRSKTYCQSNEYIHLVEDQVVNQDGDGVYSYFLSPANIYKLYEEAALEITPLDVGRVAVFEDGLRSVILSFNSEWTYSVICLERARLANGDSGSNDPKIIRVVNAGEE